MTETQKRCHTCGELPFDRPLPETHESLPTCPDCHGPLLNLWPIDA
ncbi:hypothetical protein [Nonomuraea terrae]|nr:hypothetical protein [Nonomuraea terrae]